MQLCKRLFLFFLKPKFGPFINTVWDRMGQIKDFHPYPKSNFWLLVRSHPSTQFIVILNSYINSKDRKSFSTYFEI